MLFCNCLSWAPSSSPLWGQGVPGVGELQTHARGFYFCPCIPQQNPFAAQSLQGEETLRRQQDKKKHIINIRINEVSWRQHPKSRWDGGHTCSLGGWKIRYARCHALFVDLAAVGPNGKILTQTQHLVGSDVSWEHSPAAAFPHLVLPNRDARGELLWDGGRRKKGFPPLHPSSKVGLQRGMRGGTGARSILCPHATPLLPSPPSP